MNCVPSKSAATAGSCPTARASRHVSRKFSLATNCPGVSSDRTPLRVSQPNTGRSFSIFGAAVSGWVCRVRKTLDQRRSGLGGRVRLFDEEGAKIDPRKRDGLYVGPSRGHVDDARADEIGMARAYGYGATMGAWCVDYLAYWAGNDGMVRYIKSQFRAPAFEGDVTFIDAEVTEKRPRAVWGAPIAKVKLRATNQDGALLVDAAADVELPI